MDIAAEYAKREAAVAAARSGLERLRAGGPGAAAAPAAAADAVAVPQRTEAQEAVRAWTQEVAARLGSNAPVVPP